MSTTTPVTTRPLREQIITFLQGRDEATAAQIIAASSEAAYPSRVMTELNRMRTEALLECEKKSKKKGGGELWYWLAARGNAMHDSQPAVEQNTGSSAAGASATQPAGAAVHPKPAPAAAASPSAAPVAADVTPVAAVKDSLTAGKARQGAAAKKATQNRERILLGEIATALGAQKVALAKLPERARSIMAEHDRRALALVQVHDALAERVCGEIDPSDLDEVECAQRAAVTIDEAVKVISAAEIQRHAAEGELAVVRDRAEALQRELDNKTALTEKLEHLLQSARNEAEHLRTHTGTAAAVAYVVVPAYRNGEITDYAFDHALVAPAGAGALDEAKRLAAQEVDDGDCETAKICALIPVGTAARRVVFEPA